MTIGRRRQTIPGSKFGHLASCTLAVAVLMLSSSVGLGDEPKRVLIFYSDDASIPANVLVGQQLRSALKSSVPDIQIFHDNLDSFRIRTDQYEAELVALLKSKYREQKIDLIIPVGGTALEFFLKHRADIFPDAPIVFVVSEKVVLRV